MPAILIADPTPCTKCQSTRIGRWGCLDCAAKKTREWSVKKKAEVALVSDDTPCPNCGCSEKNSLGACENCRLEYWRRRNRTMRYKISEEEYEKLLARAAGKCELCDNPIVEGGTGSSRQCIEHDHHTDKVRGLTCPGCNIIVRALETSNLERYYSWIRNSGPVQC